MRRNIVALALLIALGSGSAVAQSVEQFSTIQQVSAWCKQSWGSYERAACITYIKGITDVAAMLGGTAAKSLGACGERTYAASIQAFVSWADAHPEHGDKLAAMGVMAALIEKWPCK
jgi:hypothetical protein